MKSTQKQTTFNILTVLHGKAFDTVDSGSNCINRDPLHQHQQVPLTPIAPKMKVPEFESFEGQSNVWGEKF